MEGQSGVCVHFLQTQMMARPVNGLGVVTPSRHLHNKPRDERHGSEISNSCAVGI